MRYLVCSVVLITFVALLPEFRLVAANDRVPDSRSSVLSSDSIAISISVARTEYYWGENIFIAVTLKNVADREITIPRYLGELRFADQNGNVYEVPRRGWPNWIKFPLQVLKPGEEIQLSRALCPEYAISVGLFPGGNGCLHEGEIGVVAELYGEHRSNLIRLSILPTPATEIEMFDALSEISKKRVNANDRTRIKALCEKYPASVYRSEALRMLLTRAVVGRDTSEVMDCGTRIMQEFASHFYAIAAFENILALYPANKRGAVSDSLATVFAGTRIGEYARKKTQSPKESTE